LICAKYAFGSLAYAPRAGVDNLFNASLTQQAQESRNGKEKGLSPANKNIVAMGACLLVERNTAERRRLEGLLSGLGFACESVESATDALKYCRSKSPDLVMMDAEAVDEARDVLRATRHDAGHTGSVVILYASQPGIAAMGETILEGAAEFLLKPFDRDLLKFKLRQAGLIPN
jgi:two-component system, chemotaxis family, chemotaxis protein CheY